MKGDSGGKKEAGKEEGRKEWFLSGPRVSLPWIFGRLLRWEIQEEGQVGKRR